MANRKPIIRIWISRPLAPYYEISEEERKEFWDKLVEKYDELGVTTIIECKSNWSNEEWDGFGVEEFPDIEAIQKLARFQAEELKWPKYFMSRTYLGTQYAGAWAQSRRNKVRNE